jgi:hypothetical protein
MNLAARSIRLLILLGMLGVPVAAAAQTPGSSVQQTYQQVISANPFGILLEIFNAEYERVISASSTAGIGGSYYSFDDEDDYLNADLFWRFYMQDDPLEGWAFGAKAGVTNIPDEGTYAGIGFDLNRSWLMGRSDNFYLGIGFGLKRLLGVPDDAEFDLKLIPTIRLVNVGIAF